MRLHMHFPPYNGARRNRTGGLIRDKFRIRPLLGNLILDSAVFFLDLAPTVSCESTCICTVTQRPFSLRVLPRRSNSPQFLKIRSSRPELLPYTASRLISPLDFKLGEICVGLADSPASKNWRFTLDRGDFLRNSPLLPNA